MCMRKTGGGAIVNTSSALGHVGAAAFSVYVASKHAVEGLTKAVALECSQVRRLARKLSPLYDTLLSPAHRNLQAVMHKNSAKVFSFVDSSGSWRVKSHRGHNRGVAPDWANEVCFGENRKSYAGTSSRRPVWSESYRKLTTVKLKTGNYWPSPELSIAPDRSVPAVTPRLASPLCHGVGSRSEPSHGWATTVASLETTRSVRARARPGSISARLSLTPFFGSRRLFRKALKSSPF
jgi:hypothetical protein